MRKIRASQLLKRPDDELHHSANALKRTLSAPFWRSQRHLHAEGEHSQTALESRAETGSQAEARTRSQGSGCPRILARVSPYFHIGSSWGVSESTVCRIVHGLENMLIRSRRFHLPGKKQLLQGFGKLAVVVLDVTETPIERSKRRQRPFYSGKQKQHTLKCQLVIEQATGQVICTCFGKGRQHNFKLFQASSVHFHPQTLSLQDKGYQGIQKLHPNSRLPKKKLRGGSYPNQTKRAIVNSPVNGGD